jgi:hypothetical protein
VTSIKIDDGTIVNADINDSAAIAMSKLALSITNSEVNASAAIAGTKISPNFGSQDITTTGNFGAASVSITDNSPSLIFNDSAADSDFRIRVQSGVFKIRDDDNTANRLEINSSGVVTIPGHVDINSGLDVEGATTFNESGADVDFRVEGDTDANLLFVDASADNVGIGTTSAGGKLAILSNASTYEGLELQTPSGDASGEFHIGVHQSGATSGRTIVISRGGSDGMTTESLRIDQHGQVGIGVTPDTWSTGQGITIGTSQATLWGTGDQINLSGNAYFNSGWKAAASKAGASQIEQGLGNIDFKVSGSVTADSAISFDNAMRIKSDGFVGIGTTSPSTKLHVNGNITATKSVVSENLSGRNMIINGDMRIAQRGTSGTFSSSGVSYPSIDRIKFARNGVTGTVAQESDAPAGKGFHFSAKMTTTSAVGSIANGNVLQFQQLIERQDCVRLGYGDASAKTSVLSFYVKSSLTGTFGVGFTRNSRVQSHNITYSSANTWQFVEVVVPGDTSTAINGGMTDNGMSVIITISAGANTIDGGAVNNWVGFHTSYVGGGATMQHLTNNGSTFQITGLQYEIGSKATPFEHRSISEEFARCHRYFFKNINESGENGCNYAKAFSTSELFTSLRFPVRMRATPTVTTFSNSGTAGQVHKLGSPDVSYTSIDRLDVYGGMRFNSSGAWATGDTDMYSYTLEASAEL